MSNIWFRLSLTIVLLCICSVSYAQKKWSLLECVEYARENNIQVKQKALTVESSELAVQKSKTDYLPTINANAGTNFSFGRALDPTTYQFKDNQTITNINGSLSARMDLFAGLTKYNQLHKSKIDLQASIKDVEKLQNDISLNIAAAFLEILYANEMLKISVEQKKIVEQQVGRTKLLVDAGNSTMGALLELESQLATEEYNVINAENQLDMRYLNLRQLMQLDNNVDFKIDISDNLGMDLSGLNGDAMFVYEKSLEVLPEVKSANLRIESASRDIKIAQGRLYPTLSLSGNYSSGYSDTRERPVIGADGRPVVDENQSVIYEKYPFGSQIRDNASTSVQFGLSVPIFNGLNARRNVKNARINKRNAEYGLESVKKQLYYDIEKAITDVRSAQKQYAASVASVKSLEESCRYIAEKLQVGAATSVDYNVAVNNLYKANSQMLQAKYNTIFKIKVLEFYMGSPLEL